MEGGNKVLRATFQRDKTVNMNYNQYFNLSFINEWYLNQPFRTEKCKIFNGYY